MNVKNKNKKYTTADSMVYSCQYHVIFCPKYRRKVLENGVDDRLKQLILEGQEALKYKVIELEVMPDHVHLLLEVCPKRGIHGAVCSIKGMTSRALRQEFPILRSRLPTLWSRSKFISTVGDVSLATVRKYIEGQKK